MGSGDLLDDIPGDLLTPCTGTLRTIAFTTYTTGAQLTKMVILFFCWFLLGRDDTVV